MLARRLRRRPSIKPALAQCWSVVSHAPPLSPRDADWPRGRIHCPYPGDERRPLAAITDLIHPSQLTRGSLLVPSPPARWCNMVAGRYRVSPHGGAVIVLPVDTLCLSEDLISKTVFFTLHLNQPLKRRIFFEKTIETKGVVSILFIITVLVSSFRFIWIPMLWVYDD